MNSNSKSYYKKKGGSSSTSSKYKKKKSIKTSKSKTTKTTKTSKSTRAKSRPKTKTGGSSSSSLTTKSIIKKEIPMNSGNRLIPKIYKYSTTGRKSSNEDTMDIVLSRQGIFYGVYDGHGGKCVSKFLKNNLSKFFTSSRKNYPLNKSDIESKFHKTHKLMEEKLKDKIHEVGSTCLCVLQNPKTKSIQVINAGDCRAVLCRNNLGVPLSRDHKPHWFDERKRIEKIDEKSDKKFKIIKEHRDVPRVNGLAVSRGFGDTADMPKGNYLPDVFNYKYNSNDSFLVIASDGLIDVMENQDIVNYILECKRKYKGKSVNYAQKLAKHAITLGSGDNITVIISFLV